MSTPTTAQLGAAQWCPGCSRNVHGVCHHFNCAIGPNGLAARSLQPPTGGEEPVAWRYRAQDQAQHRAWCYTHRRRPKEMDGWEVEPLYAAPSAMEQSSEAVTIDDVPSCGQENDYRRAQSSAASASDWREDPAADERWNAGCDFALEQLGKYLGIDLASITWDGATETVEGDVEAVIGNILRAKFGEDWGPDDVAQPSSMAREALEAALPYLDNSDSPGGCNGKHRGCGHCAAIAKVRAALSISSTDGKS